MKRLILGAIILLAACTKQGPPGATGATGAKGPQGDTGVANIQYSEWTGGFSGIDATWSVPAMTAAVLDSSVVLVYAMHNGDGFIVQLPFDNVNGSGVYVNDIIGPGEIYIYCDQNDNLDAYTFRYVIIPPGVLVTGIPKSYHELTSRIGIVP